MSQSVTEECLAHPKFKELVRKRGRFNIFFCMIIIAGYGLYVLGMSFMPMAMSAPLRDGGSMTYGILLAVLVIISGMACSGFYTWWAARHFDSLKRQLLAELGHE